MKDQETVQRFIQLRAQGWTYERLTRAIRAHRRLALLAPEFFDSTEINRLEQRRKEDAEWRAIWEPALKRIYRAITSRNRPTRPRAFLLGRNVPAHVAPWNASWLHFVSG